MTLMIVEFPLIAGVLTTVLHVLTGPDHLAAVMPLVLESKKKSWEIGFFWSIGHIMGMTLIGLLFVFFKELIPIQSISNYSEQIVGAVLIGIGVWAFIKVFNGKKNHEPSATPKPKHTLNRLEFQNYSYFTALSVGVLHGFAGIAHFLLFTPIFGFDSQLDSIFYILGACFGIVIAMTAFAFTIGKIRSLRSTDHNPYFFKGIRMAGGILAIIIGFYWILSN